METAELGQIEIWRGQALGGGRTSCRGGFHRIERMYCNEMRAENLVPLTHVYTDKRLKCPPLAGLGRRLHLS